MMTSGEAPFPNTPRGQGPDRALASLVTPPGTGGLAVIQLGGPDALRIARIYIRNRTNGKVPNLQTDRPRCVRWLDGDDVVDEIVVTSRSDGAAGQVISICTHGSVRVVERILSCLQKSGAGIASQLPTCQAWADLDPIEQTLMEHLPRTQTPRVAEWLIQQASALRAALEQCTRWLEQGEAHHAIGQFDELINAYRYSEMLLDGADVVIIGPPNAGKSTLANQLFDKPWSIESDEPGTTRDWVHQRIAIEGVPLTLADTAGLRLSNDALESTAIERSRGVIQSADVQLLVIDGSCESSDIVGAAIEDLLRPARLLLIINKSDLPSRIQMSEFYAILDHAMRRRLEHGAEAHGAAQTIPRVRVSALKENGLESLRQAILAVLGLSGAFLPSPVVWDPEHVKWLLELRQLAADHHTEAAKMISDRFLPRSQKKSPP